MKESKRILTKSDITKLGFTSALLQAGFNFERMQAGGFTLAMLPFLKKIYKDDKEKLSEAMQDNMAFINTNTNFAGMLMGLLLSLEERGEDRSLIKGLRVALFGPLAGIGDAIFWFTVLPIVAGVCASFAAQGSVLGPIIFFLVYLAIFILRVVWTHLGYNLGTKAIERIKDSSQTVARAATILGVTVIGGLIASYVHITVQASIPITDAYAISIQKDFLDRIFPNILPMGYTLLMFLCLRRKISPPLLILVTFVFSIILSGIGIL